MLTPTSELVVRAQSAGVGVPAFNGITIEHGEAIVRAAETTGAPVILALSHNAVRFHGQLAPIALAYRALAESATVDIGLHLDHVEDLDLVAQAPAYGFGSVMYDGAALPYLDNIRATRQAADLLHGKGMWLESELGVIGGKDGAHDPHVRTDPDEAAMFVGHTGVDALAVAVGSSHAMTDRSAQLDFELIATLRSRLPVPLVLHGSSGVSDKGLAAAVLAGMVKINIGTQLNIAYTDAVRSGLRDAASPDPRRYLTGARDSMVEAISRLIQVVTNPGSVLS